MKLDLIREKGKTGIRAPAGNSGGKAECGFGQPAPGPAGIRPFPGGRKMEAPHSVGIRPILGKRRPSLRGFKGKDPRNHGYDVQSKLEGSDRSRPDPAHPVSGDSASGRIRFDAGGKLPSAGDRFLI